MSFFMTATEIFSKGIDTVSIIVIGIGAFFLVQGILNLLSAYGDGSDARSKNQGWIQIASGGGIILIGLEVVPLLASVFSFS